MGADAAARQDRAHLDVPDADAEALSRSVQGARTVRRGQRGRSSFIVTRPQCRFFFAHGEALPRFPLARYFFPARTSKRRVEPEQPNSEATGEPDPQGNRSTSRHRIARIPDAAGWEKPTPHPDPWPPEPQ